MVIKIWQRVVEEKKVKEHTRKPSAASKCFGQASKECKGKKGEEFKRCRREVVSKCREKR